MSANRFFQLLSGAALTLAMVSQAGATTVTIGGTTVAGAGQMTSVKNTQTVTFDGMTALPAGFSKSGNAPVQPLVSGSLSGQYQTPAGDTSTYVTAGNGTVIDKLATPSNYFGFYWGSPDDYNTFSLTDTAGKTFSITGAALACQFNLTTNSNSSYFVNFFADPGQLFTSASFASTANAFEFDNVASAAAAIPEPATLATMAGGLLLILAGALRRRKS